MVGWESWPGRHGRLSSAWFRARSDTPYGVEWLHVHETWLPDCRGVS